MATYSPLPTSTVDLLRRRVQQPQQPQQPAQPTQQQLAQQPQPSPQQPAQTAALRTAMQQPRQPQPAAPAQQQAAPAAPPQLAQLRAVLGQQQPQQAAQAAAAPPAQPPTAPPASPPAGSAFDFSALRARPFDGKLVKAALDAGVDPATVVRELVQARAGTQASLGERGDALAAAQEVLSFLRGAGGNFGFGEAGTARQSNVQRLLLNAGMEDLVRQELMRNNLQLQRLAPEFQQAYQDYHISRLRGEDVGPYHEYIANLREQGVLPQPGAAGAPAGPPPELAPPLPLAAVGGLGAAPSGLAPLPITAVPAVGPGRGIGGGIERPGGTPFPITDIGSVVPPIQPPGIGTGRVGDTGRIGPVSDLAREGQGLVSPDVARLRAMTLEEAAGLAGAPSREDIALQRFQNILAESEDARRLGIRDIGRAAAALGRIGSGQVTTDLGNLEARIQETQQRAARDLAAEAAGLELADRVARLGALRETGGQFGAEDLERAAFARDVRAMEADIGFQNRRLELMRQGMDADEAYRQAQFEYQQRRDAELLAQRESEFARTYGLDRDEFRRRLLDSIMQSGLSAKEAEMWANRILAQFDTAPVGAPGAPPTVTPLTL